MNFILNSYKWPKPVKAMVVVMFTVLMAVVHVAREGGDVLSCDTLNVFGRFILLFCFIRAGRALLA